MRGILSWACLGCTAAIDAFNVTETIKLGWIRMFLRNKDLRYVCMLNFKIPWFYEFLKKKNSQNNKHFWIYCASYFWLNWMYVILNQTYWFCVHKQAPYPHPWRLDGFRWAWKWNPHSLGFLFFLPYSQLTEAAAALHLLKSKIRKRTQKLMSEVKWSFRLGIYPSESASEQHRLLLQICIKL